MHGLSEIVKANLAVGNPRRGPGSVGHNGEGSPWRVVCTERASTAGRPPGSVHVIRILDGEVLGRYDRLKHARKHIGRLIREEARNQ